MLLTKAEIRHAEQALLTTVLMPPPPLSAARPLPPPIIADVGIHTYDRLSIIRYTLKGGERKKHMSMKCKTMQEKSTNS